MRNTTLSKNFVDTPLARSRFLQKQEGARGPEARGTLFLALPGGGGVTAP
jgi:hypothetical protein